ncbi:unnamed protein product [Rotaria sordida]|uniref:PPM-type phosphatase domain-containing protein n=1 Tax=Rotaria sordida TaxID=392033 RepID=A0A816EZH4_9BILA|nr:unnamed protein product [Rotaria sordida]CAF1656115.1 unnamed protein product [Rotaria sordida]
MSNSQSNIEMSTLINISDDQLLKDKQIIDGKWFGSSSMQGCRPSMEDFHQHLTYLSNHYLWKQYSYFSIFDGHSGSGTAHYASNNLHRHILNEFHRMIEHKRHQSENKKIHRKEFHHKPDDPNEEERIHEAGGHITQKSSKDVLRVERRLAMTRKSVCSPLVPPIPDIIIYSRKSSAAFIIIASDGIQNVMSNEQFASFVFQRISIIKLDQIASQLLDHCLEKQSRDNMTVYIIKV